MAYADWNFYAYGFDEGSQINRLTTWTRIKERSGKEVSYLADKPELPEHAGYIWKIYIELKQSGNDLNYPDLDAYSRLTGINLSAWEVELLMTIEMKRRGQK